MRNKKAKVIAFIGITYLMTLLFHIILQFYGGQTNPVAFNLLGIPMIFPFIAVIIVQKGIFKEKLKGSLGISARLNRWFLYAILIPIAMTIFLNILGIILFQGEFFVIKDILKILIISLLLGLSVAAISAFFEEVAWRGFLYKELEYMGIIRSSLVTGIVWAVWHIPVVIWYKYPYNPLKGTAINLLQLFILSLIISYIRYKSKSVIPATMIHGISNTLFLSSSALFFNNQDVFSIEGIRILTGLLTLVLILLYEYFSKGIKDKVIESVSEIK